MRSALGLRRAAVVAAPALAALLIVAGFFLDPAIDESGRELAEEYAAHPGREQVSALAFHFAFALLAIPAVALIVAVRGRGAWLANLAAFLAFLGTTSRSTASWAGRRGTPSTTGFRSCRALQSCS